MIKSISYSDTFTLAGIARLFGTQVAPSEHVPLTGIPVIRDDDVPAGCVLIRHDDQGPELYVLPCTAPGKVKA